MSLLCLDYRLLCENAMIMKGTLNYASGGCLLSYEKLMEREWVYLYSLNIHL